MKRNKDLILWGDPCLPYERGSDCEFVVGEPEKTLIRRAVNHYLNSDLMLSKKDREICEALLRNNS
jgi:hypothetical protein